MRNSSQLTSRMLTKICQGVVADVETLQPVGCQQGLPSCLKAAAWFIGLILLQARQMLLRLQLDLYIRALFALTCWRHVLGLRHTLNQT